jgi:predicted phosphoribosyltransferase
MTTRSTVERNESSDARSDYFVEQVFCVQQPTDIGAVGACYRDFRQLTDADVEHHLAAARHGAPRR